VSTTEEKPVITVPAGQLVSLLLPVGKCSVAVTTVAGDDIDVQIPAIVQIAE